MSLRRKYAAKRRSTKTRKGFKRSSVMSKQVYRLKRQVRALRPELKYTDNFQYAASGSTWSAQSTSLQDQDISFSNRCFLLNGVSPGTGRDNRIGWKVNNKFVHCRLKLSVRNSTTYGNSLDLAARSRFRVIMFMDRNQTTTYASSTPTLAQLLLNTGSSATDDTIITSFYQPTIRSEWTILHDKVYQPRSNQGAWINLSIRKKLHSMSLYNSSTAQGASASSVGRGAIYMFIIAASDTDDGSPVNLESYIDVQSRFYYTDV